MTEPFDPTLARGTIPPGQNFPYLDTMRELVHTVGKPNVHISVASPGDMEITTTPFSVEDISKVFRIAREHNAVVVPAGNRQRPEDAVQPGATRRLRIVVDCRNLASVVHLDETSLIVCAQAGMTGSELERQMRQRGLSLGDFPPTVLTSTLGGLFAARTTEAVTSVGFLEESLIGLSAVLASGRAVHIPPMPKRAVGPDLCRLLTGSVGTLGIITSVWLRLHQQPEARYFAAYRLPQLQEALSAVHLALREEAAPRAIEVLDPPAWRNLASELGIIGEEATLAPTEAILLICTAGPTDLAVCDRELFTSAVHAMRGSTLSDLPARMWWERLGLRTDLSHKQALLIWAPPSAQYAACRAVLERAANLSHRLTVRISRFDRDGAVLFFVGDPATNAEQRDDYISVAAKHGGQTIGHTVTELSRYWISVQNILDPKALLLSPKL